MYFMEERRAKRCRARAALIIGGSLVLTAVGALPCKPMKNASQCGCVALCQVLRPRYCTGSPRMGMPVRSLLLSSAMSPTTAAPIR